MNNVERLIRKLRSREAETRRFDKGALGTLRVAQPSTEKVPERSGKTDAIHRCENIQSCSYGDPVLEWRRPGGSDLALMGQGLQADLSLPSGCGTLATRARQLGLHQVRVSVRTNRMMRKSARVEESVTPP